MAGTRARSILAFLLSVGAGWALIHFADWAFDFSPAHDVLGALVLLVWGTGCCICGVIYEQVAKAQQFFGSLLFGLVPALYTAYQFITSPARLEGVPISLPLRSALLACLAFLLLSGGFHYVGQISHVIRRRVIGKHAIA